MTNETMKNSNKGENWHPADNGTAHYYTAEELAEFDRAASSAPTSAADAAAPSVAESREGGEHSRVLSDLSAGEFKPVFPELQNVQSDKSKSPSDAAITACALMVKGICMTSPREDWLSEIEARIRFMLKQVDASKGESNDQ